MTSIPAPEREWFYHSDGVQKGPIGQAGFEQLVKTGEIVPHTPVWTAGMATWSPFSAVPADLTQLNSGVLACSYCGRLYSRDDIVEIGPRKICASCKPVYLQKLKEGVFPQPVNPSAAFEGNRAGFWIRCGAKLIDYAILWLVNGAVSMVLVLALFGGGLGQMDPESPDFLRRFLILYGVLMLIQFATVAFYSTWMIGRYGATVGKMACRLRVVTPFGQPTYARAFARYGAEILSGMILLIGYLMVAFDSERRGLHDRICNTWVIHV